MAPARAARNWTVAQVDGDRPGKEPALRQWSARGARTGYSAKENALYATNRYEVTRLKDVDGDGRADKSKRSVTNGVSAATDHEYGFGSRFDKNGAPLGRALPRQVIDSNAEFCVAGPLG